MSVGILRMAEKHEKPTDNRDPARSERRSGFRKNADQETTREDGREHDTYTKIINCVRRNDIEMRRLIMRTCKRSCAAECPARASSAPSYGRRKCLPRWPSSRSASLRCCSVWADAKSSTMHPERQFHLQCTASTKKSTGTVTLNGANSICSE